MKKHEVGLTPMIFYYPEGDTLMSQGMLQFIL